MEHMTVEYALQVAHMIWRQFQQLHHMTTSYNQHHIPHHIKTAFHTYRCLQSEPKQIWDPNRLTRATAIPAEWK